MGNAAQAPDPTEDPSPAGSGGSVGRASADNAVVGTGSDAAV